MGAGTIGLAVMGGDSNAVLARIEDSEERGIDAAWLTVGGASLDGVTLMAAAGARTERILLGTCIVPTWGRHPVAAAQQVQVAAQLSGNRFRFGIGPSHVRPMTTVFGADYRTPLTALREYLTVTRTLLHTGAVEFEGSIYRANVSLPCARAGRAGDGVGAPPEVVRAVRGSRRRRDQLGVARRLPARRRSSGVAARRRTRGPSMSRRSSCTRR